MAVPSTMPSSPLVPLPVARHSGRPMLGLGGATQLLCPFVNPFGPGWVQVFTPRPHLILILGGLGTSTGSPPHPLVSEEDLAHPHLTHPSPSRLVSGRLGPGPYVRFTPLISYNSFVSIGSAIIPVDLIRRGYSCASRG